MSKSTKQILMLSVLGLALVFFLGRAFLGGAPPVPPSDQGAAAGAAGTAGGAASATPAPANAGGTQLRQSNVNIDELVAGIREVDFNYETSKLDRDPMTPLVGRMAARAATQRQLAAAKSGENVSEQQSAAIGAVETMRLTGILYDEHKPLAVIDDTVVGVGYEFPSGATVLSIESSRVNIQVAGITVALPLSEAAALPEGDSSAVTDAQ